MEGAQTGGRLPERAYYHLELGYNYRMTSMQAATGLVQLRRLGEYLEGRRRNAAYLSERLGEIEAVEPPYVAPYAVHSYYKYICRLRPGALSLGIEELVRAVAAEGVPVSRRYPTPLPKQPVFRPDGRASARDAGPSASPRAGLSCPVAERLAGELFTLLVHPTLAASDLDDVARAIGKVVNGYEYG